MPSAARLRLEVANTSPVWSITETAVPGVSMAVRMRASSVTASSVATRPRLTPRASTGAAKVSTRKSCDRSRCIGVQNGARRGRFSSE